MKKGNTLLANISKLNTFVHMVKSNEFLNLYINKIMNKKCRSIKFINDFDYISLDLLYTSLEIINNKVNITKEEYNKIDKKELKYYMDKIKGIKTIKDQVPELKTELAFINYLKKALSNGEYIVNNNNTVKFDNGLILDSDWVVETSSFLITSLNNNMNLSSDGFTYYFNTATIPPKEDNNVRNYLKKIKLYEYTVKRKDERRLSFQDIKYLIDKLGGIDDYDFKELKSINSEFSKLGLTLTVNKKNVTFVKEDKSIIEKLINENDEKMLIGFIEDRLNCNNSESNINKRHLYEAYELIKCLVHAYKCNYSLNECRKLFTIDDKAFEINNALAIANFYITYVYDETNLHKYFNYALLRLDELLPSLIDYETKEYKTIIKNLSTLSKKVVTTNRRINKYLDQSSKHSKKDMEFIKDNARIFAKNCQELEKYVSEIKALRIELSDAKDENRHDANINKTKLNYIKEAIITGHLDFNTDTKELIFDCYSDKDYQHTFHLEISLENFINIVLSDYNRNIRINFYQL